MTVVEIRPGCKVWVCFGCNQEPCIHIQQTIKTKPQYCTHDDQRDPDGFEPNWQETKLHIAIQCSILLS